jgi:hypothetical protein
MRLNQLLAITKQVKSQAGAALTGAYHNAQKADAFAGLYKRYSPINEEGEQFPDDSKVIQSRVPDMIKEVSTRLAELIDVSAQRDGANCVAKADVVLEDDKVLLKGVPATHLLWLEKTLTDLSTFVAKLPTLPSGEEWVWDENQNCYATKPAKTAKTKKVPKPFVKYEATKEHPAQVDTVMEDVLQGYWETIKYSAALPAQRKEAMANNVSALLKAVKCAREKANQAEVPKVNYGETILGHIFG